MPYQETSKFNVSLENQSCKSLIWILMNLKKSEYKSLGNFNILRTGIKNSLHRRSDPSVLRALPIFYFMGALQQLVYVQMLTHISSLED